MIYHSRLLQMARKWQKMAALARRRVSWTKPRDSVGLNACSASTPSKGNFVVYSQDGRRFMVPLVYINTSIFRELFEISKEEIGLPCNGPIVIPCDAVLMEYIISLLPRRVPQDVEKALLSTVTSTRCSTSSVCSQGFSNQQLLVYGF